MIEIQVKQHDKFSFEFKTSFISGRSKNIIKDTSEFSINTWLFVPNSLDINRATYPKEEFYKDTKSNVRLITPVFSLNEIYEGENSPFNQVKLACKELVMDPASEIKIENYSYHIRIFSAIVKSAVRDHVYYMIETSNKDVVMLVNDYISEIITIKQKYRELLPLISNSEITIDQLEYFSFGDDFIGNVIEQQTFCLMNYLEATPSIYNKVKQSLVELLENEITYKKQKNYPTIDTKDWTNNYLVVMRRSILKKFIESDLYLNTKKLKDGAFAEQFYYGIAAAVSMIFATVISFTAQIKYGNFTYSLFFALVISYVFKDRIKDLMRYYFSTQLGKKYFDTKRELEIRKQKIGWTKESFDFVPESKVPAEVLALRQRTPLVEAESKIYDEKILLYKKLVSLSPIKVDKQKVYKFIGINDITRFNLTHFVKKMDNPQVSLYLPDKDTGYLKFEGEKVYALHFIIRCESDENLYYKKYLLLFNREGIREISELND